MKIKTTVEFLAFADGIVDIYQTDENDDIMLSEKQSYCFGNRTIGVKRYYAARQHDIKLDRVIHIQRNDEITSDLAAVINHTRYKIEQVQHFADTNPPSTVLSLTQAGLYRGEEDAF